MLSPLVGQTQPPDPPETAEETAPMVTQTLTVLDGDRAFRVPYVNGIRGPLVALQPLAEAWRGSLSVGPLGQRHELTIADQKFLFGPGSARISAGDELVTVTQAPRTGVGGVYVPLDFLDLVFAGLGVHFEWRQAPPQLVVSRSGGKVYRVQPTIDSLGEVTTLVLEFSEAPRYRIETGADQATVSFFGNQVELTDDESGGRLRSLVASDGALTLGLAPNTGLRHYTLQEPFRLVIDLVPETRRIVLGDDDEEQPESVFKPPDRGARPFTVVIDPGHGGEAQGAQGRSGIEEKTITLQVANLLADRLRGVGVQPILTRSGDVELELTDRTAIANHEEADLFVSLHVNSSYGRSAHGAETFFLSLEASDEDAAALAAAEGGTGDQDEGFDNDLAFILWDLAQSHYLVESQRLAKLVQQEFNASLGLLDRGVKQAPFRVLRGANMPAILVELGFISNPEEERKLQDPAYQRQLVSSLVRALDRYRGRSPEPVTSAESPPPADAVTR